MSICNPSVIPIGFTIYLNLLKALWDMVVMGGLEPPTPAL